MKITKTTHILFIALIAVIVFSTSLKNGFVWDDEFLVINNPYVKDWECLPEIFSTHLYAGSGMDSNYYRPMQSISYLLDYSVWKLNPFGYHLTSLLMHIVNAALVYLILIAISSLSSFAFLAAILFAIAPAISGITYYIAARSDLLMALFLFLSYLFFSKYLKDNRRYVYVFSVISFVLSLLSREASVILPALLILEIYRRREKVWSNRTLKLILPYLLVLGSYVIARFSILNFFKGDDRFISSGFTASIPLWERILTDFRIMPMYLRILLFPYDLHMGWYVEPAKTIFQADIMWSILLLGFLAFIIKIVSRSNRLVLFGAMWFLITLFPVLNIYPIPSVLFGDGWLYVPSVGFFIILGISFRYIVASRIGRKPSVILTTCFIIYYALFTISYSRIWKDEKTLLGNVLKYEEASPSICFAYNNLAKAYYNKGEFEKAIEYDKKAIISNPKGAWMSYTNLALAYMAIGRPIKAIGHFKRSIKLKKDYVIAYCYLAHGYSKIGLEERALEFSNIALELDPDSYKANENLGYIYSVKGEIGRAKEFYKKAAGLKKEAYQPHFCLGNLYMLEGEYEDALREYEEALRLGMEDYEFYNSLSVAYIRNKRYREAEEMLMRSIALNSNQLRAHNHLGNLYSMLGYFEQAFDEYKKAFEAEPDNMGIRDNIRKTKLEWKAALKKNDN